MLDLILAHLRANPPPGVDPEYVAAFARRHRPELERLVAQLDAGDGRLYDRFGPRGAPKPGERGYKPPAERSPDIHDEYTAVHVPRGEPTDKVPTDAACLRRCDDAEAGAKTMCAYWRVVCSAST